MSQGIAELFTISTAKKGVNWKKTAEKSHCAYLSRKCLKIRKSNPELSIGACSVNYRDNAPVIICPHRLLEGKQIFADCLHLLTLHQPGYRLHIVSEIALPGGNVDYFLVSEDAGKVKDFVGIELQTLDTTGTTWPQRQKFLKAQGVKVSTKDASSSKTFGMNWKMTAKTTLVQLHHKVNTFEHLNKKLVLVVQDCLLGYMQREFSFSEFKPSKIGDSMHIHSYALESRPSGNYLLRLAERLSTDGAGVAHALGLQAESKVELSLILSQLEAKISDATLLKIFPERTEEVAIEI
ncbi:MAG: NotI family restriction endonuclease [Candidatus Kapaibacterium sp.]